jgi:hypothetical protein
MLADDFGDIWWPKSKPMPNLLEIQRHNQEAEAER